LFNVRVLVMVGVCLCGFGLATLGPLCARGCRPQRAHPPHPQKTPPPGRIRRTPRRLPIAEQPNHPPHIVFFVFQRETCAFRLAGFVLGWFVFFFCCMLCMFFPPTPPTPHRAKPRTTTPYVNSNDQPSPNTRPIFPVSVLLVASS